MENTELDVCEFELLNCHACDNFETYIHSINDLSKLKVVKRNLLLQKMQIEDSFNGKVADWLVTKVGTMACFYLFIVLATLPLIVSSWMGVIGYVSSGYLQLILLPLIVVAGNRADNLREQRMQKEWRINLINAVIEEIVDSETLELQLDEAKFNEIMKKKFEEK